MTGVLEGSELPTRRASLFQDLCGIQFSYDLRVARPHPGLPSQERIGTGSTTGTRSCSDKPLVTSLKISSHFTLQSTFFAGDLFQLEQTCPLIFCPMEKSMWATHEVLVDQADEPHAPQVPLSPAGSRLYTRARVLPTRHPQRNLRGLQLALRPQAPWLQIPATTGALQTCAGQASRASRQKVDPVRFSLTGLVLTCVDLLTKWLPQLPSASSSSINHLGP